MGSSAPEEQSDSQTLAMAGLVVFDATVLTYWILAVIFEVHPQVSFPAEIPVPSPLQLLLLPPRVVMTVMALGALVGILTSPVGVVAFLILAERFLKRSALGPFETEEPEVDHPGPRPE